MVDELFVEMGVLPAFGDQFAVRSALDDLAGVDDEDAVGLHDRAQAVRHDECRTAPQQLLQGILHEQFGAGVHGAGSFIQHENAGVGEEGAREADQLPLTQAHVRAALADIRVVSVLK